MLLAEPFAGDESTLIEAAQRFWDDVKGVLEPLDIPTKGAFDEVKARRRIRFLDSAEHFLNGQRYVFRERIDVESDERQVTLKFRHPDRYVASDRDMAAADEGKAETKFEEDVKPPFVSVFSYSTTVEIDGDADVSRLDDVVRMFPGLRRELTDPADFELADVGFAARELVLVGAGVLLGKRDAEAECAMVFWHDDAGDASAPKCVEFSFKYGDDEEDYRGSVARDAHDVLKALSDQLPEWVHPTPVTKTAFVYG
jgi:hypothetical protein